jgi:hypothetical protein
MNIKCSRCGKTPTSENPVVMVGGVHLCADCMNPPTPTPPPQDEPRSEPRSFYGIWDTRDKS